MCAVEGCVRPVLARRLCRVHYEQDRLTRTPPCSVEGCDTPSRTRGLCNLHSKLQRRTGSTAHQIRPTPEERFWKFVSKTETCWLWTGSHLEQGYGQFGLNNRNVWAHRFAYELMVGPIPDGLHIDHLCRVPACVRPDHLEPVTQAENNRRAAAVITSCPQGHDYTPDNLIATSSGHRRCKTCHREDQLARYHRQKETI